MRTKKLHEHLIYNKMLYKSAYHKEEKGRVPCRTESKIDLLELDSSKENETGWAFNFNVPDENEINLKSPALTQWVTLRRDGGVLVYC